MSISLLTSEDERIEIGQGTCFGSTPPLIRLHHQRNRVVIGKYCSVAEGVVIFAGGNHPIDYVTTYPLKLFLGYDQFTDWSSACGDDDEVTQIGNDVWIGHEACILSGAKIGDGAIIGARAVVRGVVPPYAIVIGNPAQVIRYRFDSEVVSKLLKIKWWDWPLHEIEQFADKIASNDIEGFLTIFDCDDLSNSN